MRIIRRQQLKRAGSGGQGLNFSSNSAEPDGPRACTEEESVLLRSLSDKNAALSVHIKVSPPEFMQNQGTCGVKQLAEEDLLTSHDIIQRSQMLGQLAKLQMLSETRRSTVPFL